MTHGGSRSMRRQRHAVRVRGAKRHGRCCGVGGICGWLVRVRCLVLWLLGCGGGSVGLVGLACRVTCPRRVGGSGVGVGTGEGGHEGGLAVEWWLEECLPRRTAAGWNVRIQARCL